MNERYQRQWETLGAEDPFWAVLTDPRMKDGGWDKAAFFQTGVDEIDGVLARIAQLGIELQFDTALDYGCGVGRLTRALATPFQRVTALDISDAMLSVARIENQQCANIHFIRTSGVELAAVADESVDLVYSNIVLQHSPQPVQARLIAEFARVLRRGGSLVFQTPSRPNIRSVNGLVHCLAGNRILNLARRLKHGKGRVMEMHAFGKTQVVECLTKAGMGIIDVDDDFSAGPAFVSYRYFSVKR